MIINTIRKGSALIVVMFVITLLLTAGVGILYLSEQGRLLSVRSSQDMTSRICADAGIEMAIAQMNAELKAGTFNDSDLPQSIGETLPNMAGAFSYMVEKVDSNYIAISVGARGNFRRTIQASLRKKSAFEYGLLSKNAINLAPGMDAGAYDSANPGATGLEIDIGTTTNSATAALVTKPGSVIQGNLFCVAPADCGAVISNGGTLTGEIYQMPDAPEFYSPVPPAGLPLKPDFHTNGATIVMTPANSGVYNVFSVDNGGGKIGKLVIGSGTVILSVRNFMDMGNGAEIDVNAGAYLIMYVACNFYTGNGSSINYLGSVPDPSHIQLYGTGTTETIWALKAKNEWCAVVYAPYAQISLQSGRNMFGAFIARTMQISIADPYKLLYDVNLQRATNLAVSGDFMTNRWKETVSADVPEWAY